MKNYLDRALEKLEKSYMDRGLHFPEKLAMNPDQLQRIKSESRLLSRLLSDPGLHFPEKLAMNPLLYHRLQRIKSQSRLLSDHHHEENKGVAVDIEETPKEYVFYADVPGLTKSEIQVYVEEEKFLVMKCEGGKRKCAGVEDEEGCKYLRVERKRRPMFARKFTLPGDANVEGISASCVDGVLTVTVPRIPPAMEFKTIQISVN